MTAGITVVVPTVGRASLAPLLAGLASADPCPVPVELLVVDDRRFSPAFRVNGRRLSSARGVDGRGFSAGLDRRRFSPAGGVGRRRESAEPLDVPFGRVIPGQATGPAAARNDGWRAARYEWVAFLDDDVLPDADWLVRLAADIEAAGPEIGGVQGRVRVPLPAGRRPTDWERATAALIDARWITADMAYRRAVLEAVGGFDERLPRAFREDTELAHRVLEAGWSLSVGDRTVTHPVRPENGWISVRTQRGNADDALLRRLYGPRWRDTLGIPGGRRHRHAALTAAAAVALGGTLLGTLASRPSSRGRAATSGRLGFRAARPRLALRARPSSGAAARHGSALRARASVGAAARPGPTRLARASFGAAALAGAAWAAGTAEFAVARIAPGPRDRREVATMLATSVVIPPVAIAHWLRGWWRWRGERPLTAQKPSPGTSGTGSASSLPAPDTGGHPMTARTERHLAAPGNGLAGEGRP